MTAFKLKAKIKAVCKEEVRMNWSQFHSLSVEMKDGVRAFWEPGYDYSDPNFWLSYEYNNDDDFDFIRAVRGYDALIMEEEEER